MSCETCYSGCDKVIPDKCVQYTGVDIPALGICSGDFISDVTSAIISKIENFLQGSDITLQTLNLSCTYTQSLFGTDRTLGVLIQKLIDSQCTLKSLIDALGAPGATYIFNTNCLTLPVNPTKDDILQAAIDKLCSADSRLTVVENDYVKSSELEGLVNSIITPTNSPIVIQFSNRLVPYTAMSYFGPLSNFDNTGKGLSSVGFEKIYICNGSYGTPDMRGRTVVGAVRNIPGGTLDTAVDPLNINNPNTNYSVNDKFGTNYHKLEVSEIPSHSHNVVDPGHSHALSNNIHYFQDESPSLSSGGGEGGSDDRVGPKLSRTTHSATTGIGISAAGGGGFHNNRQPSIAGVWIMYIP